MLGRQCFLFLIRQSYHSFLNKPFYFMKKESFLSHDLLDV
ncbi:hypothetical protein D068_cds10540 [Bacillus atrophaeus UCMB-5137]|nr:hypothetical protein D068_cds10540 [Bacillus atrophaeus UCMB-5137]